MADEYAFPKGELMRGKKGLVMGVANHNSIAWGIASQLAAQGAEMAFTYQGEALERRVRPLAESIGVTTLIPADVTDDASMDAAFAAIEAKFGTLDFVVHSVAFANKDELKGSFVDNTTREGFLLALNISAFSFVDVAKRAARIMPNGGSLITMTYLGSERTIPNYNTMGVAKAALEAATRYIARDLGPKGIRCNAISAGAMRTLALAGIAGGRGMIVQRHEGRHLNGRRRRRRPVAGLRPRPLDHRRSGPCRRRLPHDGHAGRGGGLSRRQERPGQAREYPRPTRPLKRCS
jgi:enoyl-[acyl-carrier protein] reductase I